MDYRTIRYEQLGAVVRITANRPEVLNAQSRVMLLEELDEAFRAASRTTRCASSSWPAPASISRPATISAARRRWRTRRRRRSSPGMQGREPARLWERFFENTMRWRDLPKPTIAQVQGYCIMGGLMIASACDLIIAADDALFADRAVKWGGAHVQYFSMPWDLGPRKAKEYLFTGEFIDAAEAEKLGLVNRVVPRASAGGRDDGAGAAASPSAIRSR